jgi:hypothetical protein
VTVAFTMTERADQLHHDNAPAHSTAIMQTILFLQSITSPRTVRPLQHRFGSLRLLAFPKAKIAVERKEICKCDGHILHQFIQRRLTSDWLAQRESDYSRMHSKVSSDWLPSVKVTWPVLGLFKRLDTFRTAHVQYGPRWLSRYKN